MLRLMKRHKEPFKGKMGKVYHFIFHDDSIWSWIVNIILAFILVKFVIYPVLAFVLGSSLPLVAVISGSMEHDGLDFDDWWAENGEWYESNDISKEEFESYKFINGFDKGDVMVLGRWDDAEPGDTLVYFSGSHSYPIIHRVIYINEEENTYQFKGDNNDGPDPSLVDEEQMLGKALLRIPKIGWIKIWFTEFTGIGG